MLAEMVLLGSVFVAVLGVFEVSTWLGVGGRGDDSSVAALREAMGGPDGAMVRAEFRRRGVQPPEAVGGMVAFGWPPRG